MIFVRADANNYIGAGHIMRCLSIAKAFRDENVDVVFITADINASKIIENSNFRCISLDTNWDNLDLELPKLLKLIIQYNPTAILVDSYYVTETYLSSITRYTKVAYIDDMNKAVWPVDFLINYNIFYDVFDYTSYNNLKTRLLLGTRYIPLREEFVPAKRKHIKSNPRNILLSAGGADPQRITEVLINDIVLCEIFKEYTFHTVIGTLNPRLEYIQHSFGKVKNLELHCDVKNMRKLMDECDIAISA